MTKTQIAEEAGISIQLLNHRLALGKSIEEAIETTVALYEHNGQRLSLKEWARVSGIGYTTLYARVKSMGLTMTEALEYGQRK